MLAKVMEGTIDPVRSEVLADTVEHELMPTFLAHEGAVGGYWMVDRSTGHVAAITLWEDAASLRNAAGVDGAERSAIAARIALRVLSVNTMPVLAARILPVAGVERPGIGSLRLTWVEGVAGPERAELHHLYEEIVADQAESAGFCGSYWFGEEASGEGCAVSLWQRPADLEGGTSASRRRRRRVAKALGCRVGAVREYQLVGFAANPQEEMAPTYA